MARDLTSTVSFMRLMTVRRRFRRSLAVTAVVACGVAGGQLAGLFGGPASGAASSVPLGTASATAQSFKVNPQTGALSLGISFGVTLTNYQNKVAIAEARGIDLGIIGTLLAAQGCDGGAPTLPADQQPQPVHVEARNDTHQASATGSDEGLFNKDVHVTDQPFADSVATSAPFGAPGAFQIGAAKAESISRYNDDGTREAIATTDISTLTFGPDAAPVAKLAGLHWEVRRLTGSRDESVENFTIGSMTIAGTPVPTTDVSAAVAALNGALNTIGIELTPPQSRSGAGFIYEDPMKIGVVPNPTRDQIAGTLLGTLQPARQAAVDALLQQSCSNATYITVGDVVLGSVTGAGAFELELGGVHATSGEYSAFAFPTLPAAPPLAEVAPIAITAPSPPPASQVGAATLAAPTYRTPRTVRRAAADLKGSRGGKLALAAAIGLGLIALTVELDRRKMRRAQLVAETGD